MTSSNDPPYVTVPFDSQFLEPVIRTEKTATVRIERYDVEAGDQIILANKDETVEWALAEVTYTVTCPAHRAREILTALDAEHSLTNTDRSVVTILQPHYSTPVRTTDTVQLIGWEIVQPFAEAPKR